MARIRYELDPERSQVWIEGSSSIHPIRASATGLHGWIELEDPADGLGSSPRVAGEVRIAVDRLKSGNPLVDAETRRRIDAGRHPEIVGAVAGSTGLGDDRVGLGGTIAFRGEVQPVEGELHITADGDELRLAGTQRFDVRRWGLQPPKIGLLRVHPDIDVRFEAIAVRT